MAKITDSLHNVVERHIAFLRPGTGRGLLEKGIDHSERLIAQLLLFPGIHPLAEKLLILGVIELLLDGALLVAGDAHGASAGQRLPQFLIGHRTELRAGVQTKTRCGEGGILEYRRQRMGDRMPEQNEPPGHPTHD